MRATTASSSSSSSVSLMRMLLALSLLAVLSLLSLLSLSSPLSFAHVHAQPVWSGGSGAQINPPLFGREGSVYGNDDSEVVVFAGGVNLLQVPASTNDGTFTAFNDIWSFNISSATYTQSQSSLPLPIYFATGGWSYDVDWLVIYSGRTNSRDNQVSNSYFLHVYIVNCYYALRGIGGASLSTLSVSTLYLTPTPTPRQHAGSFVQDRYMYVLGGVTGATGTLIPNDRFVLIRLDSGATRTLSTGSIYFPTDSLITPILFAPSFATNYLYVYGGAADAQARTLAPSDVIYVYKMNTDQWLPPLRPLFEFGPNTPSTSRPSLIYSSMVYTRDLSFVSMIGGARTTGFSHNQAITIVTANMTALPETGRPTIYISEGEDTDQFTTPRQRAAIGVHLAIDWARSLWLLDLYIYSGADYEGGSSPTVYAFNTSVWSISASFADDQSKSSNLLGAAAIVGIVIGVLVFVLILVLVGWRVMRVMKAPKGIHTGPQSDAADTAANSEL